MVLVETFIGCSTEGSERFASGYQPDEVTLEGRFGRYSNYQAGLGLWQLERLGPELERRRRNAERLLAKIRDHVPVQQPASEDSLPNWMLVTTLFPDPLDAAAQLLRLGVDSKREYMRNCAAIADQAPETFPNAARAEREVLHIPAHSYLIDAQIDRIAAAVVRIAGGSDRPAD